MTIIVTETNLYLLITLNWLLWPVNIQWSSLYILTQ